MENLERIFEDCENLKTKEEIKEDWKRLNKVLEELKEPIDDNFYNVLAEYIEKQERLNFIKGFKYAVHLWKECEL